MTQLHRDIPTEDLLNKQVYLTIGTLKLLMTAQEALQIVSHITSVKRTKKASEWHKGGSHDVIKPMDDSDVVIAPAVEAEVLVLQAKYEEIKGK